jgi:hypothetical protein
MKPRPSSGAPTIIGSMMPKRSASLPISTPPTAKPIMAAVYGTEAPPRSTANSASIVGNTTTADHRPTPPIVLSASDAASRRQA